MNEFTFFWKGPFSQWHKKPFVVDGITYNCAEQYMMAEKARLFGDVEALRKIMATTSPREQKKIGREVKGYDEEKWDIIVKDVIFKGNYAKFSQNKELLDMLLKTNPVLVEASPYDTKYGVGLLENDPKILDRNNWKGKNWLGEVLTKVRERLKSLKERTEFIEFLAKATEEMKSWPKWKREGAMQIVSQKSKFYDDIGTNNENDTKD